MDYSRVIGLIGEDGYRKVRTLKVGVAGLGVVGLPLAVTLARLGVRELRLLDNDVVKLHNLPNGFLLSKRHVGMTKDRAALEVARRFALDHIDARAYHFDITDQHRFKYLLKFVSSLDLIYGCFDNVPARLSLNTAAVLKAVKYVDIGIGGFDGRVRLIDRDRGCYACDPLANEEDLKVIHKLSKDADCDYAPTFTILPVCSAAVSHALVEGLKFLGIVGQPQWYNYLYFDFLTPSNPVRTRVTKRTDCPICGEGGMVSW